MKESEIEMSSYEITDDGKIIFWGKIAGRRVGVMSSIADVRDAILQHVELKEQMMKSPEEPTSPQTLKLVRAVESGI